VFVGNLSFEVTREELIEAMGAAGRVVDAKVPTDRETGRPRGFAFVEFESEEAARRCIDTMNGQQLRGRSMRINEADDRPPRPPGGNSGFRTPSGPRPFRPGRPTSPGAGFPPPSDREGDSGGDTKGRRFRQKPSRKPSQKRRRRDDVADDVDDY